MSPESYEAIPYANQEQLTDLFDTTSEWLFLHGTKKGSSTFASRVALDGNTVYKDDPEDPDRMTIVERYVKEYNLSDVPSTEGQDSSASTISRVLIEFAPAYYWDEDDGPPIFSPATCAFVVSFEKDGQVVQEDIYSIRRSEHEVTSDKIVLDNLGEQLQVVDEDDLDELILNMKLEEEMGLHQWNLNDYEQFSLFVRVARHLC
jgi:hypothetical protein